jgi:predicted transcriptional regulator
MTESATLSVRLPAGVKADLERLADDTDRSKSYLAAEAIEAYVKRELAIIEGVERGRAEIDAGLGIPHDQVVSQLRRMVADSKVR